MSSLLDRPTREALDQFGGGIVPGAGSAAALTGALAAKLARAADREALHPELERLATELIALVDRDAQAFATFWRLFKAAKKKGPPSGSEAATLTEAQREATSTPLAIAEACRKVATIARELTQSGLPAARAEAVTAEKLAGAAAESAVYVVRENLRFARGAAWSLEIEPALAALEPALAALDLRQTDPPAGG